MNSLLEFKRADRIAAIEISSIVQLTERVSSLVSSGRDVIALSTGEPDFPTPRHIIDAAHQAALDGKTRYPATAGLRELREAVAGINNSDLQQVIISTGAKQVLANAMLATLNNADEVIIPTPYWTSYSDIVSMAGGTSVTVPCSMENDFKLSPDALESAITSETRWLILNSPSNPSGTIYSHEELAALADVLTRHPHVWVLSDEIYEHLSYTSFTSFKTAAPELAHRTLIVSGVSKAYSMTGWRIGWGVGPAELIKAMSAVQGQITSGACSISQMAALAAITGDQSLLEERKCIFKTRRDKVVSVLNSIEGVVCPEPDGAFYVFPNIEEVMTRKGFHNDSDFCSWLLDKAGVAIVPGSAFGFPNHARISFAYSDAALDEGLSRIVLTLAT